MARQFQSLKPAVLRGAAGAFFKEIGRRPWVRWGAGVFACLLALHLVLRFTPLPADPRPREDSTAFLDSEGNLLRLTLSADGKYRLPLKLSEMSPELVSGFLAYEDQWFYFHPGVNPVAVLRALRMNWGAGHVVSGGSTLTMQLAKMLAPRPRTLGAKIAEAFRALQLEARFGKREILEFYLNRVPMGGNLEGVGAASLLYFGKPASRMSLAEAALLVGLPRSPALNRPDRYPLRAFKNRNRVLDRIRGHWRTAVKVEPPDYNAVVPDSRKKNPFRAPFLVERLRNQRRLPGGLLATTLQAGFQETAERELKAAVGGLYAQGVRNGAVIIVHNPTREVLAYVGSPDWNEPSGGRVNGADILRSPGSVLKPFLFARAVEEGLVTPRSALVDIPRDFGGYKPANYEGTFMGILQAREALTQSLNLPAVELETALEEKSKGLKDWLTASGMRGRGREGLDPGLSVVLGAYPLTLEEVATLYSALADGGLQKPLCFVKNGDRERKHRGSRILSEAACYVVLDILSENTRPDLPASWEFSPHKSRIAFKTGTSFGFRDAWCAALTPDYTVVVWLGNANAKGSPALLAARTAAPLAVRILDAFTRTRDVWFKRPAGVGTRDVCAVTGQPAGTDCPSRVADLFLPGVSRWETCDVHRRITIRKKDGLESCPACMTGPASDYGEKVVEIWPVDLQWYLQKSGKRRDLLPGHVPGCPRYSDRPGPRVTSPRAGARYEIRPELNREQQRVPFTCHTSSDVTCVYWFLGERLVLKGPPDQTLFWEPEVGNWRLTAVDSKGRSSSVTFTVWDKPPRVWEPLGK